MPKMQGPRSASTTTKSNSAIRSGIQRATGVRRVNGKASAIQRVAPSGGHQGGPE